jgi:ArsR family transcriptional regulator
MDEMIQLCKALSDPTRLALLKALKSCPHEGGYCVTSLANRLGVSQPAVSQHLRVLRHLGVVQGERQGYRVHYTLNYARLEELCALVIDVMSPDQDET